jgi:ligand-binding sensor domain-containing protein/signal transduction histidine kinase
LRGFNTFPESVPRPRPGAWRLAVVTATMCAAATLHALDPERELSQYLFDRWGSGQGFPGGAVHGITQGRNGYLWIAADRGLVRFDGLAFRLFEPPALTAGTGPTVLGVAPDVESGVWARLKGPALLRYRPDGFEDRPPADGRPESVVTAMVQGRGGAILMSTLGQGVLALRAGRFQTLAPATLMPNSFAISIAEATDGAIWLGTRDIGLLRLRGAEITQITDGLPNPKVNCLLATDDGDVWIGTDAGVVRWHAGALTREGVPAALLDLPALAMLRDSESNLWIAAGARGLFRVNDRGVSARRGPGEGILGDVTSLFEDRDANLWVGTSRGLQRLRNAVFASYSTAQGLPSDGSGPLFVDRAQRTWFAPSAGGLYWWHDGRVGRVTAGGLSDDVVYSIDGRDGDLWVGRQRGGLTRLREEEGGFVADRFTQRDGLTQDSVYAVHRARDGAVWAGTLSGGVSRYKNGAFTSYGTSDGLASNTVSTILEASDGTMWFGTPNGVSTFSRGGWRRYTTADGLQSNEVNVLMEDSKALVWVGTAGGIAIFDGGQALPLANVPAMLEASILGLAEDRTGSIWVTTADRALRVNRDGLMQGALFEGGLREYGVADGLLALEGVKRHRSVVADGRGRVWLSMARGLSVVDPAGLDRGSLPALTQIEELAADGQALDLRGARKVPSGRRRVTVSFAGLSLGVPERIRFRYRLDGFDRDWSEPVAERQAVYTNLPPGPYRFRVIASNSDGLWGGEQAALSFEVEPTIWQTAWFRAAVVIMGILAVWGLYWMRVRRVAGQLNMRFEERLAERTRIAQELHDTLLQGFLSASMQLYVAAQKVPADSPAKASLNHVFDLMKRVIDEGRNAVRGLRTVDAAPDDLERAFARIPAELAAPDMPFRVVVEGRARKLHPLIRDEMYRIGREAIVNAFRHSGGTQVEMQLEYAPHQVRMLIRDDGRGIDEPVLRSGRDGHWGLSGMRERAHRIGASLRVWSRADAGTEIELLIPNSVAFQTIKESESSRPS